MREQWHVVSLIVLLTSPSLSLTDDVIGCGGFIKSSRVLDFSRINVQLYSKAGSLKFETECAPNNGYFFIPVYEHGSYTIKVSPPLGWKFSPAEVTVDIDGVTDDCSTNKDINFNFDGFGVVGRVKVAGSESGPAGVEIQLKSDRTGEVVQSTVTQAGGHYVFSAVEGTDQYVAASHSSWVFEKNRARVTMTGDNGQAEDIVIAGFDVQGEVTQPGGEAMPGVSVLLFGQHQLSSGQCPDNSAVSAAVSAAPGLQQLCHVKTDNKGRFLFPVVPPGSYKLVPFHQTSSTKFEVTPQSQEVSVSSGSVSLSSVFLVSGFSVSGSVLSGSAGGQPVSGAQVRLTSSQGREHSVVSDQEGRYSLDSITSDTYTITAQLPGMEFTPVSVQVSPASPALPSIIASKFLVTGQLDYSTVAHDTARKIIVSSKNNKDILVDVDKTGSFSVMLPRNTYALSIRSTPVDDQMGIVFAPVSLDINISNAPLSDLYFSPVRVTVSGSVSCLGSCPPLTITLKPEGHGKEATMTVKKGEFMFENQLPGAYLAFVKGDGLCFQSEAVPFKIESDPINSLHFTQTGWMMDVQSSHETVLKYSDDKNKEQGDLDIPIGPSTHCLPSSGPYKLSTSSCHIFHEDQSSTSWSSGDKVVLRSVRHLVSGSVVSTETIPDLQMKVTTESKEVHTMALTSPENKDGLYYYR